jgi:hypothetical protein
VAEQRARELAMRWPWLGLDYRFCSSGDSQDVSEAISPARDIITGTAPAFPNSPADAWDAVLAERSLWRIC